MNKSSVRVDFWDVGYGDAAVVWLNANRVILIDCGPSNSRLPEWVEKQGIQVDLVVLTHNDADHIEGFLSLMRLRGSEVGAYAWVQDRPAESLRRVWQELLDGRDNLQWPDPTIIAPRRDEPQDLLASSTAAGLARRRKIKLRAIYPPHLDSLKGQTKGPNWSSAIVLLYVDEVARVAWPGDLPLRICHEELSRQSIHPSVFVGPHHGGPVDIQGLSEEDVMRISEDIGHEQSWISVGWHGRFQHPRTEYLSPVSHTGIAVRCSQLTLRCDARPERFGHGLLPSHDWLGLLPPVKGPSCMGPMRIVFEEKGYVVSFEKEHREAAQQIDDPLCNL